MNNMIDDIVEIDILKLIKELWQNILVVILSASLCGAAFFAFTYFFISPQYLASTTLYVNNNSFSIGATSFSISSSQLTTSQNLVDTYILVLNSRTTLEKVRDEAGLDYTYDELCKMISTEAVNDTAAFRVDVLTESPTQSELIANTIARILPERISEIVYGSSVQVIDYAIVPSTPDSPNYTRNTIVGGLVGVILSAVVIVLISIYKSNSSGVIESVEDLRALCPEIPVFAVIPDMRNLNTKAYSYTYYNKSEPKKEAKQA